MLEHVARRAGRRQAVSRVRRRGTAAPPLLTLGQIERICDACAAWDAGAREWRGGVRGPRAAGGFGGGGGGWGGGVGVRDPPRPPAAPHRVLRAWCPRLARPARGEVRR